MCVHTHIYIYIYINKLSHTNTADWSVSQLPLNTDLNIIVRFVLNKAWKLNIFLVWSNSLTGKGGHRVTWESYYSVKARHYKRAYYIFFFFCGLTKLWNCLKMCHFYSVLFLYYLGLPFHFCVHKSIYLICFPAAAQKDKEKEDNEEVKPEKETASPEKKPPASNVTPKGGKKSPGSKGTKASAATTSPLPKGKTSAAHLRSGRELRKQPIPIQAKPKKPGPPMLPIPVLSPPGPPGSRHHVSGALRVSKSTFTIPKKQPQAVQKDSAEPGPSPNSRTPPSPVSSTQHSAPKPTHPTPPAAPPSQPPPNNQMRSNIRRSLTDILYKRLEMFQRYNIYLILLFFFHGPT